MASLVEYFQAFHKYAYENALNASVRTLYFTILGEFNKAYWPAELSKSVGELEKLGGFSSKSVVQRAKAELGTHNLVKIRKDKRGDNYLLTEPSEWRENQKWAVKKTAPKDLERQRNAGGTQAERPDENALQDTCAQRQEDIKELRQRKENKKRKESRAAQIDEGVKVNGIVQFEHAQNSDCSKYDWKPAELAPQP